MVNQFRISIRSFADIQAFVALAIAQPFAVFVGNEDRFINAKSLMAMFTLSYRHPLTVSVDCDEAAYLQFRQEAARFLAA